MCYRDRKEEQEVVLSLLQERLIKEHINVKDIKPITLVDTEGVVWYQGFEDDFMILEKGNKTILFEIVSFAKNENVWYLLQHGKLYNFIEKKDYDELILLCHQTILETIKQAKMIGARIIVEKIYETEKDLLNDDPWKSIFKNNER